ncbi:hypothetical protein PHLCEN_2v5137 [Hermanssonia centrifuga]|uniref:C2H2-type domain-containing protein n=1 Tax=Hermanssonia centrifuga TaxID=98765 RepID=A0A2R6PCF5_9APHY|nr:hypothetical protein PHLCEN_2v5137 [Hermanssonia centrifuga]
MDRPAYNIQRLPCPSCKRVFRNTSGLTQHRHTYHSRPHGHVLPAQPVLQPNNGPQSISPPPNNVPVNNLNPEGLYYQFHSKLNGRPCDSSGQFLLDPNAQPLPQARLETDWTPYNSRLEFETAEFLFQCVKMGQVNVNLLLELWAASLVPYGGRPSFSSIHDMLQVIDSTPLGDAPWTTITAKYMGALPANPPPWMVATYEILHRNTLVCARNMLLNTDFAEEFDITPYREYSGLLE